SEGELCSATAALLATGNVVGWFQGRMEFGPRALGNRSILGDAANENMQQKINLKIKFRENFRPFAPSVPVEKAGNYFDLPIASPYMLFVVPVKNDRRLDAPAPDQQLSMTERLHIRRSVIPAVTHVDFSARVQTVHRETNQRFYDLLEAFGSKTGSYVLVNTSFNVRGEPIVCTPDDAYRCFMRTAMDYLVIGDFIFDKKDQPVQDDVDIRKEEFPPD
ncbi:MAG TPA: carbamoyltransferase C-terminal domain-containing protein, partial [Bacteroidia bacterium]|nr:carbamoyltransferase C-terminal domain-containing protein [Bacteroidia bacterium]